MATVMMNPAVEPDYTKLFSDLEEALIREGSKRMRRDEVVRAMEHRRRGPQKLSDDEYFKWLILVVFYSGFRAETVTDRQSIIIGHFPEHQRVMKYGDADVDYVIVCYGQESHLSVGLERGICLRTQPRCDVCGVTYSCRYFANHR